LDLEDEGFTLGKLLEMDVARYMEQIQAEAGNATAELALEEMLQKVRAMWESGDDSDLTLLPYKEFKDVFILGGVDNIIVQLEDSLVSIGTIAGSRFVGPIREEVEQWQKDLMLFQETLDEWLMVQRQWMYLESIFSAGDIKKQLPTEAHQFQEVDNQFKTIMRETNEYPSAIKAGTKHGRLQLFKQYNDTLERIQKQLEDYLQSKRVSFPRFFFLSNDELLEILAQARRPQAVQPHLRKCFDNLVKLKFLSDKGVDISGMFSAEGEEIPFYKPLKARGNVEKWLLDVEDWMCKTVHHICKEGFKAYPEQARRDWVREREAQTVSSVGMIMWCTDAETALVSDRNRLEQMNIFYQQNVTQLSELTELVRGKLTGIQRLSIVALVTQDVHNRDIVELMCIKKVQNILDFSWQQQLRYYWDMTEDDLVYKQVDAVGIYGYEYMGATTRLVITPLTDRCWMTITGALWIKLGAAPAGPAGTGKTESTKDLAKAIARQCVVFNCSDQIDYKMMGKLFSGVVSAGAWTCLDEFNRILIEVLSVVAQQLLTIRTARLDNKSTFSFEGHTLALKATMGVFITMNPGYAGRTELPDNLKALFRPVAMMIPDYRLIAQIILYSEGFKTADELARKMVMLYKLSSEQLSKQDHYDFGMRAVKSVLVMAGSLRR
jgi:dynein heavy chain